VFARRSARALALAAPAPALVIVLLTIYSHVDIVLLGYLVDAGDVGSYAAAYRLVDAVTFLAAGALTTAVFPVFARLGADGSDAASRLYERVTRLMGFGLLMSSILLATLARPIVSSVYGSDVTERARLLLFLAPSACLISLNFTATFFALAVGRARIAIVSTAAAAVISIVGILAGVHLFGVAGAAAATLVAEIAMLAIFHFLLVREGFSTSSLQVGTISLVLLLVPVLLALAYPESRWLVAVLAIVIGPFAARGLGLVREGDVAAVRRLLRKGS
jgi:O-antigen/teichoic acid export membrane protein